MPVRLPRRGRCWQASSDFGSHFTAATTGPTSLRRPRGTATERPLFRSHRRRGRANRRRSCSRNRHPSLTASPALNQCPADATYGHAQRSACAIPASALSTCSPQPSQVALPQLSQVAFAHMVRPFDWWGVGDAFRALRARFRFLRRVPFVVRVRQRRSSERSRCHVGVGVASGLLRGAQGQPSRQDLGGVARV